MILAEDFIEPTCAFVRTFTSSEGLDAAKTKLARSGVFVAEINGRSIISDESLFSVVSESFRFPRYFGGNWDALNDCLRDLEWLPAIGYVVMINHATDALRHAPATMARFVEACGDAAAFWMDNERAFHLVVLVGDEER